MRNKRREKELPIQEVVERLYVEHKKELFIFAYASMKSTSIADDIVQDVFLEAIKKYDSFCVHPNQLGWLYRTASYKMREYKRRLLSQNNISIEETEIALEDKNESFSEAERNMALDKLLTEEERIRYYRYFLWGYSVQEIDRKSVV